MNRLTKAPAALIAAAAFGIVLAGCASDTSQTADLAAASQEAPSTAAAEAQSPAGESASPAAAQTEAAVPSAAGTTDAQAQAPTAGAWIDQATYEANKQQYHDAGNVVLFFNASWCPTCQQAVSNLDAEGVPPGLTVVSLDYDSASDLKQEYGVTVQHTFVQVDESGAQQAKFTGAVTGEQISSKTV
jgi:thiol-disulfide isomerase/thioredoxin